MNDYYKFRVPPNGVLSAASVSRLLSGLPDPALGALLAALVDGLLIRCARVEVEDTTFVVEGLLAVLGRCRVEATRLELPLDDVTERVYLVAEPCYADPGPDFDFTERTARPCLTTRPDGYPLKMELARLDAVSGQRRAGGARRQVSPHFWPDTLTTCSDPRSAAVYERVRDAVAESGSAAARAALRPGARWADVLPWLALEAERRQGPAAATAATEPSLTAAGVACALSDLLTGPSPAGLPPTLPAPGGLLALVDELPAALLAGAAPGDERVAFAVPQGGGQLALQLITAAPAATCYVTRITAGGRALLANTLSADGPPKLFGPVAGGERVLTDVRGGLSGGRLRAGLYRPAEGAA
jgi:hypothetical protein